MGLCTIWVVGPVIFTAEEAYRDERILLDGNGLHDPGYLANMTY